METVELIADNNLCVSCGACKVVCPTDCISYLRRKGNFVPLIDDENCISCGKCFKVCPGKGIKYKDAYMDLQKQLSKNIWVGDVIRCQQQRRMIIFLKMLQVAVS
ncbi:MAG: NADH-quinone oxidoreductase subunit I [bacterium]